MFYSTLSLSLIALALGVFLLVYLKNQNKVKNFWAFFAGWFVIILSLLCIIGSTFYIFAVWNNMHHKMM